MQETGDTRLHPWRALRLLAGVARDPERTDLGTAMVRALEGRSPERLMVRLTAHPMGPRLLAEGRRLERTLGDLEALEALPPGSLGQSYAAWMGAEGLSAQGLMAVSGAMLPNGERSVDGRSPVTHDLWHVLTGYGRDLLGEFALLHFTWVQTRNTGLLLPCWLGLLSRRYGREGRRVVFEARRRARRAAWLPAVDWEALLPQSLASVRDRLRVGPPPRYTPVWPEPSEGASQASSRLRRASGVLRAGSSMTRSVR